MSDHLQVKKPLLILNRDDDFFAVAAKNTSLVDVIAAYGKLSFAMRVLRRMHIRTNMPFYSLWFSSIKHNLASHDVIIMHATTVNPPLVKYIHRKFPNTRVIFWYWNPVSTTLEPDVLPDEYCEKWSFDKRDAVAYNMKFNTQFFYKEVKLPKVSLTSDVVFVGKDKGRYEAIIGYKNEFQERGLSCDFSIMPTEESKATTNSKYSERISYSTLLTKISQSKAILDIVDRRQTGLTLRPMESIFFQKKLITNLEEIDQYDFYDSRNIFILGKDNIEDLPKFIKSPYHKIDQDTVMEYDFASWLKRFGITG